MSSFKERVLPELLSFQAGYERDRAYNKATRGNPTILGFSVFPAGVWIVLVYLNPYLKKGVGLPIWVLLPTSITALFVASYLGIIFMRRRTRRKLREFLVSDGIPICIPCGYDLTGNESGVCSECGEATKSNGIN